MIEPYQWYLEHASELGFNPNNIGPASVDLCLNEMKAWVTTSNSFVEVYPEKHLQEYTLVPFTFYLASTLEYIKVPTTHAAMVQMRSSLARKGLGHKMAGYIDPGFEGSITLELESSKYVDIYKGERIVQIVYMRLTEETLKPYTGKYKGQVKPTEAY